MNRRDFLSFKREPARRIAELSCERLYMRVVDTQLVSARTGDLSGVEPFEADLVRVVGAEWLASPELKGRLESVLRAFRAAGGRVE
jgi:hypothetical protein